MVKFKPFLADNNEANILLGIGCSCICLACFFTPLSTSLMGVFSSLGVAFWAISGHFKRLGDDLKKYPATIISLVLFFYMALAIIYSPVEVSEGIAILKKYRELLLLPIVVSMLAASRTYRHVAEYCFIAGCITLMLISYGMALEVLPEDRYGHSIVFHITHNFFMAILSFWSLNSFLKAGPYRLVWLMLFILAAVNIFYIAPGRTGMLVFICLILLLIFQQLSLRRAIVGILVFCLAITAVYHTSDNFSRRVSRVVKEISHYKPGKARTSIGQRFDWYRSGVTLIKQKPFFGHGTGAYPIAMADIVKETKIRKTDNPHNEFIFLTVQLGLTGLFLFLALITCQVFSARKIALDRRYLLHGVLLALLSGSLINSLLFDSQQGHFYLFMSAALMTADQVG